MCCLEFTITTKEEDWGQECLIRKVGRRMWFLCCSMVIALAISWIIRCSYIESQGKFGSCVTPGSCLQRGSLLLSRTKVKDVVSFHV